MDGALLTAQPHGLDRHARQAPRESPIEQDVQRHLAPRHGAFHPMPPPAPLAHVGPGGTGAAALGVDQLPGKHRDQHEADKVGSPRREHAHQGVDCTRRQGYWRGGQRLRGRGWSRQLPTLADLWPLWLPLW